MENKNKAQDNILKNYEELERNKEILNKENFDILAIQKEMEIENIFLTDQNIEDLKKLNTGQVTVEELVSKAFNEIKDA